MLELTATQTLIALPSVGRISGIGLASAVFTCYLVKLLVKPFIDVKLATNPYREFATNAATGTGCFLEAIALQVIAGVSTLRGVFLRAAAPIYSTLILKPECCYLGHECVVQTRMIVHWPHG